MVSIGAYINICYLDSIIYQLNSDMLALLTFIMVVFAQTQAKRFVIGFEVKQKKPLEQIWEINPPPLDPKSNEQYVNSTQQIIKIYGNRSQQLVSNGMNFNIPVVVAGINYSMSVDTASSNLIIKGDQTTGQPPVKYQSLLLPQSRQRQKIRFVSSNLVVFRQKLNISFNGYEFENEVFVTESGTNFNSTQGILGIGTPVKARFRPTFMEKLLQLELISNYSYGVNLNMLQPNRSFISFGQPDPAYYDEEMKYYPIYLEEGFYMDFESVSFGTDQSFDLKQYKALLDTGATMLSFSNQLFDVMKEQFNIKGVNQCGYYTYALVRDFKILMCIIQDFEALPQIAFTIQGHQYVIKKEHYLRSCSLSPEQEKNRPPNQRQVYYCETYLKINSHKTLSLSFGSPFFSRYYTYFDLTSQKIGLAKNKENLTVEYILSISKNLILSKFKNVTRPRISQFEQVGIDEAISDDDLNSDQRTQQNQKLDNSDSQEYQVSHNTQEYFELRESYVRSYQQRTQLAGNKQSQNQQDEQLWQIECDLINQEFEEQLKANSTYGEGQNQDSQYGSEYEDEQVYDIETGSNNEQVQTQQYEQAQQKVYEYRGQLDQHTQAQTSGDGYGQTQGDMQQQEYQQALSQTLAQADMQGQEQEQEQDNASEYGQDSQSYQEQYYS